MISLVSTCYRPSRQGTSIISSKPEHSTSGASFKPAAVRASENASLIRRIRVDVLSIFSGAWTLILISHRLDLVHELSGYFTRSRVWLHLLRTAAKGKLSLNLLKSDSCGAGTRSRCSRLYHLEDIISRFGAEKCFRHLEPPTQRERTGPQSCTRHSGFVNGSRLTDWVAAEQVK
jgi:hypothetical protein